VRLYFPLAEPLAAEQHGDVALGLCALLEASSVDELGEQHVTVDRASTCDLARLMYLPTLCADAPYHAIHLHGAFPDLAVLAAAGAQERRRLEGEAKAASEPRAPQGPPVPPPRRDEERVDDHGLDAMRAAGAMITVSPRRKSELTTHCPWHDDQSPSLDITADGRMVCRAGCRPGGQPITWLRYVCEVRGLSEAEAFRFARDELGLPSTYERAAADPGFADLDSVAPLPPAKTGFGFRAVAALTPVTGLHEYRLWGEWITKTALTILSGPPGVGKSTLMRGMVAALADGKDFLGVDGPGRPIKVAVLDYETAAIFEHHQWEKVYGDALGFVQNVLVADAPPFLTLKSLPVLLGDLAAVEPDLVVIDTVSAGFLLEDENSNSEMEGVVRLMRAIARTGPAVLALAHPSKDGSDLRGASALLGGLDTLLAYNFDGARPQIVDETTRFLISVKKNRVGAAGTVRIHHDGEDGFATPDDHSDDVKAASQRAIVDCLREHSYPIKRAILLDYALARGVEVAATRKALATLDRRGVVKSAGKGRWRIA